jgi:hypothetical protein
LETPGTGAENTLEGVIGEGGEVVVCEVDVAFTAIPRVAWKSDTINRLLSSHQAFNPGLRNRS